jgi:hypothetical protein
MQSLRYGEIFATPSNTEDLFFSSSEWLAMFADAKDVTHLSGRRL